MTKENGYQKRDREIARLRGVIEDCMLDLTQTAEHEPESFIAKRSHILSWAEKLRHSLNKRGYE
jgi:hypothetical protein